MCESWCDFLVGDEHLFTAIQSRSQYLQSKICVFSSVPRSRVLGQLLARRVGGTIHPVQVMFETIMSCNNQDYMKLEVFRKFSGAISLPYTRRRDRPVSLKKPQYPLQSESSDRSRTWLLIYLSMLVRWKKLYLLNVI